MKISPKTPALLFSGGILLCLLQIWLPGYYLTADGPSHVYNAQILHDLWSNKNVAFYDRFYNQVAQPNPNWTAHILLTAFMYVVDGFVAEKLLLSLYVILFCGGFYLLLKKISGSEGAWWPLAIPLFVFTHALTKGFYNFSFSLAFYPWMVILWLRYLNDRSVVHLLLFMLSLLLTYFSNLLGFAFGMVTCCALTLSVLAYNKTPVKELIRTLIILGILAAPFLILMFRFSEGQGGMQLHFKAHFYRAIELLEFKHLINFSNSEVLWCKIAGGIFCLTFLIVVLIKPSFRLHQFDGFLLALAFVTFIYLTEPDDILNRMMDMSTRTQLFVIVLMLCVVAYRGKLPTVKSASGVVLLLLSGILSLMRLNTQMSTSSAVKEYLSAADHIQAHSIVLPLTFSIDGLDEKANVITDRNHSFRHTAQYLGICKPLIVLDNYEAKTGYFPLIWNKNMSPYTFMGQVSGIEELPPKADMTTYEKINGATIDYVLLWCYQPKYVEDTGFRHTYTQLLLSYTLTYSSPTARLLVYKRK